MRRWVTKKYQINCGKIAARYGISEIMAEVLVKRGLFDWRDMDDYLFPDMDRLADACLMKDLEKAAGILAETIRQGKKIFIVGDAGSQSGLSLAPPGEGGLRDASLHGGGGKGGGI